MERPKYDDRLGRAERDACWPRRRGNTGTCRQPGGRPAADTVSGAETPTVVLLLEVRRSGFARIGGGRRAMMMGNARALTRDRRDTIVLGACVDQPVPEEYRDQPELDCGGQRTEPTASSHENESRARP